MDKIYVNIFIFCLCFFFFVLGALFGSKIERDYIIERLCSHQKYDFCEIDGVTYKLKDKENVGMENKTR